MLGQKYLALNLVTSRIILDQPQSDNNRGINIGTIRLNTKPLAIAVGIIIAP
jgi:hypothetical protein